MFLGNCTEYFLFLPSVFVFTMNVCVLNVFAIIKIKFYLMLGQIFLFYSFTPYKFPLSFA